MLSHVLPLFVSEMRYSTVSPASVKEGLVPLPAVIEVTRLLMEIPGCRVKLAVQVDPAFVPEGVGAGDIDSTLAVSDISPASMSA